ncbi:DUF4430 domain-containing protein [Neobacillus cucumis]|nr:DNA mismatch repair ATPase MutL [Neobacillus cucumis]
MKHFKITVLLSALCMMLSLAGCSSSSSSKQQSTKETKSVEVTTKAETKQKENSKPLAVADQTKKAAPATETKAQQPAVVKTESEQTTQPTSTAAPKTTTNASTNKNAGTSTTKPAGTAANKTTSTTTNPTPKTSTTPKISTTTKTPTTTNTTTTPKPVTAPKPETTVTLSIVGPKDKGTILAATKIKIEDGYTIFDVVKHANGITIDSSGSGATAYIEGINNIYEFDYGAKSGWVFKLNGASITKSVGVIKVKAGDRIACYYTE